MKLNLRRWYSVPALVFLGAGLVQGGADLPRSWALFVLGVPFVLTLLQFLRPTRRGWRLAFGSFCLLILTTVLIDLTGAIPRRVPPLPASALMVVLFLIQFGFPAWMLWLANPDVSRPTQRRTQPSAASAATEPGDMPPNNRVHPTTCAPHDRAWLLERALRARCG